MTHHIYTEHLVPVTLPSDFTEYFPSVVDLNVFLVNTGYRVSPQALNVIIKRYNKGGRIFFDDYVACCVKLRALTGTKTHRQSGGFFQPVAPGHVSERVMSFPVPDSFRQRDSMQQGCVNFQYDDVRIFFFFCPVIILILCFSHSGT